MTEHLIATIADIEPWPKSVRIYRNDNRDVRVYVPERMCRYEFVPNIVRLGISLNSCGLKCSECGRDQLSLEALKYCPDCGCKVVDE